MNTAEKLACTYLRLNGFLLTPHFTIFSGENHTHIDIIGLRSKGSKEEVDNFTFPLDDDFFSCT